MRVKKILLQTVLLAMFFVTVVLTQGDRIVEAWQINRLRLGIATSMGPQVLTPDAECRILLAGLDHGMVRANQSLEDSVCLTENSVLSDLFRLRLGEAYATQGDLAAAQRVWQAGEQLDRYFLQQAAAHLEQGALFDAQSTLKYVGGWNAYPSTELHLSGMIAQERGKQGQALDLWQQAIEVNAYHPSVSPNIGRSTTAYEVGRAAASSRDWELARDSFSYVIELSPRNPYGWMRLGLVHFNGFNEIDEAESALRKSLAYRDIDWAHFGLGRVLAAQGRDGEAMVEMLAAFVLTQSSTFRDELLALLSNTNDRQMALSTYDELLKLIPNDPIILTASAERLAEAGELEKAIEQYEKALSIEEKQTWRESLDKLARLSQQD